MRALTHTRVLLKMLNFKKKGGNLRCLRHLKDWYLLKTNKDGKGSYFKNCWQRENPVSNSLPGRNLKEMNEEKVNNSLQSY